MATLSYAEAVKAFQNASAASAQNVPAVTFAHDWQQNNLDRATAEALLKVDQALAGTVPGLTVTSAYRPAAYNAQVGGAQGSQHIQGKAIDLDLSSFTPQQKQAVLNAVMAQPEIKGIGVYDKNLNTLHFDTRSGERVAWGPDYTSKSLGTVLNGYTQPMLTGWLNGAPTAASAATAMASGSPMPQQAAASSPSLYGASGLAGGMAAPSVQRASFTPTPAIGDYQQQAPQGAAPPPPPLTQMASSWLPKSLQPGGQGFSDVLGSEFNHATTVPDRYGNMYLSDPGPYGIGALLNAITSGAPQSQVQAIGDQIAAQVGQLPLMGKLGALTQLTNYIKDVVPQQAPGTVRYLREALTTNPALAANVPKELKPALDAAFKTQMPATGNVPVAMPNFRPPMPPQAPTPPPLVAGPQPDPLAPKMASFASPDQAAASPVGSMVDSSPTRDYWQSPPQTNVPTDRQAQLFNYPSSQGSGFGSSFAAKPPLPSPSSIMASLSPAYTGAMGFSSLPSSAFVPKPPAMSQSAARVAQLMNYPSMAPATLTQAAANVPTPRLRPPMPTMAANVPMPNLRPPTKQVQIGQAPPPPPMSQPPPMSPQDAFQAQYGPAPATVNWAATLAPDPFSQAAPGSYVLNDLGSRGPATTPIQQAASEQNTDSYLVYPDFSYGY